VSSRHLPEIRDLGAEIEALKKFHADEEQNRRALVAKIDEQQAEIDDLKAKMARLGAYSPPDWRRVPQLDDGEKASADLPETGITAIRLYRARTGCSLYEAKQAVDAYRAGRATK
jgi:hypothetical protein